MSDLTTINILSLFQTSKDQRATFVQDVITRVEEGGVDALKVHLQIKAMEDIVKSINADELYKSCLLAAAEKNGKKFTLFNAEFNVKEAGTKYDYSHCGDIELLNIQAKAESLAIKIKERQEMLKKIKPGTSIVDEHTGEVIKLYPPTKSSTTIVAVTLK